MKAFADGWFALHTEYEQVCGLPLWLHAFADASGIVLLDSGIAGTPETSIRGELAAAGLRIEDVSLVVNSHAHPDHMGGNGALAGISSPVFAGPALEAGWLEDNDLLVRELWDAAPDAYLMSPAERADLDGQLGERVRIDRLLRDDDQIVLADTTLQVITTSGHSPGHIAVHDAGRGVLFTFDDVQGRGLPVAGSADWLAPLYLDVERYRCGLHRLRELDFATMRPSHGDPLDRDAALARIDESLTFVDTADEFVREYVDRNEPVRLQELAVAMGTRLGTFGGSTLQTRSIAKAHLDHLVRSGDLVPQWTRRTGSEANSH
jgi:glyoxylase-like metal-dependent hydrolase (beta-lactamase superfamily II)